MNKFFELDTEMQIEKIMQIIDENKKKRSQLVFPQEETEDPFIDLFWKHKEVVENSNPIPVPENTRLKFMKRIVSKLIRTYTTKQVHFNTSTSAFLELILKHFKNVNNKQIQMETSINKIQSEMNKNQIQMEISNDKLNVEIETINRLLNQLKNESEDIQKQVSENQLIILNKMEAEIKQVMYKLDNSMSDINTERSNTNEWLSGLNTKLDHQNEWLTLIDKRLNAVENYQDRTRKEIFAELKHITPNATVESTKINSRIINQEKITRMIDSGQLKVNLGCGNLTKEDYINIDMRQLEGVDIVADVRDIPLDNINELYLAHVIEHFPEIEMENYILPYWYSLLSVGGKIRVICPNWESMIKGHVEGRISFDILKEITFGSQEYEGNQHYNMFSPRTLKDLMKRIGFRDIKVIAESRQNGLCLEMEIEGVR